MRGYLSGCLLAAALLLLTVPAAAEDKKPAEDPWLGRDKASHLAVCFSMVGFTYHLARLEGGMERGPAKSVGLGASLSLGLSKEIWDRRRPGGRFSYKDLLFDLAGAGLGLLIFTTNK